MGIYDRDYYKDKVKKEDKTLEFYKKSSKFMKWAIIIFAFLSFAVWLLAVFTRGSGYGY